eukprot:XP_011681401.1 PREDICTED: fibropellin-1-like [Strongylocentrotus purpuratus]
MNGAVCRDVISGYYCDCPAGYAGALCDHVNSECTVNTGCGVNEVCTANQCVCERDRIRGENDICIGVTEVKEYSMTLTVSEVDGQPAVYDPSLMGAEGEEFRQGIEYEIRQIIGNDASLSVALVDVVTRNIFSGSIVVEMALIFRENSSNNSSNINLASVVAATTTDENILRESGTAFTIVWNASAVQDANECEDSAGNDCSPYAQCMNTDGSYECTCLPGYENTGPSGVPPGRNCTDINECSPDPCLNGATCSDGVNGYTCTCADGYSGDDCGTDINECSSDPCLNSAACSDGLNGYTCTCADGYSGDDCGTDINECSSDPCLNGAACTDEVNGYSCICVDGYSGDDCRTDINECSSDPCLNGAACSDGVNGYTCTCADGYSGDDCGTDEDECIASPCQNGGACSSLANRFLCECSAGYSGDRCQIEPVTCVSGNSCGELKVCNTEEMCECGPDYVENASGQCEVAYSFEVSLTITSLNGGSISFTIALTDVTSSEYIRLAFILRRLLLLQVRILRRLARIIFTSGSVIATFEIGTDEPMSPNDLQQMILSDLGNGNITSGGSSIGVDPDSLVATDVNECLTASDNDCSHNADCVNVEGSYNCTCREGYADRSPDARRPGRVCTGGLSTGTIIALSVGLGVVFLLFIILTCTACVFMQSRANLINKEHYARSPYNVRGHPTHRTRDGGRAFKTDVDRDFADLYGKYAAPRPIPPFALYGDGTRNWYLSDGRGHMDSPFGSRGPDYHMSPPRGSVARPSHRGSQRPHGYSASPVDRLQPSLNDFEDTLPPYSRRYDPNFEEDDEFHRPYYVSGEAIY